MPARAMQRSTAAAAVVRRRPASNQLLVRYEVLRKSGYEEAANQRSTRRTQYAAPSGINSSLKS